MSAEELLRVEGVRKTYDLHNAWGRRTGSLNAVDGVDLTVRAGETLAIVGESGSGKSTLGRLVLQMERPTEGRIFFRDTEVTSLDARSRRPLRGQMQVVFQDPFSSLNPYRTALQNVLEPLKVAGSSTDAETAAREALAAVGIGAEHVHKLPRAFSGGQRQRIAIARAIAPRPQFIVCDEPVSALDASLQAQVTALLQRLQRELALTYLFISHDLQVVREIATRTAVMQGGKIVEVAPTAELFASPRHPYTRRLLDAVLVPDPQQARARLAALRVGGA